MTVSNKIKPAIRQIALLQDTVGPIFRTEAEKRVYFGEVAERIAMESLGARQMSISAGDMGKRGLVCFDGIPARSIGFRFFDADGVSIPMV